MLIIDKELNITMLQEILIYPYYSILAYCKINSIQITKSEAISYGREAKKLSDNKGYEIRKVTEERYGFVGSYHIEVLKEVFAL